MALRTAGSVLVVFLWSVAVVLGQNGWSVSYTKNSICTLKGSTVELSCSYTYPRGYTVTTTKWYKLKKRMWTEIQYTFLDRIKYRGNKENDCTLRITDLRLSDSAGYRFRLITSGGKFAGSPVSLTVTDVVLVMDPTSVSEGARVTLTCRTKCTLDPITSYSWYKNGQPIPNSNTYSPVYSLFPVSSEDAGRYSCAVEGHEDLPSPEDTLNVRYGPKNTSVSVSPSGEIVEGSSVTLTCSSDANPPVDKYTWYKKNITSPKASGQSYNITNISSEESGEYYCEAENKYGRLNSSVFVDVQYGPKNTSVSVSPSGEIVEGSSVTLTCSSDANPPVDKYTWYKNNITSPKASGQSYNITNISSEESGEYYCEAENTIASKNSTALMIIGDSSPVYDNISSMAMTLTATQTAATVDQDDVHYASVHFSHSKNQEVPLYSTVQKQKQDEDVQYAVVKLNRPSSATK
ncbi:B-cell receptor CD22-like [Coregonus clupeaformis]|uniref:B-cell receptor CD22-like n=1 Tax=Coregonus clupeaformis TaxID=59861 RepID=UPI001E1C8E96|nr:B-cell receptor CD22-like [Coregonus clupeaformis]